MPRLRRVADAFVQNGQVVRGEKAAPAAHRVLQLRSLADLERAQPARLDHRQQLGGAARSRRRAVEQNVADREVEVGRVRPVRHFGLRQVDRDFEAADALEREQGSEDEIVTPCGIQVRTRERLLVVGQSRLEARPHLEVLAELVVQVRVARGGRKREPEQPLVAARLRRLLRREVAVVRDRDRQAPARQRRLRLLVDDACVADAARQHARHPARCLVHRRQPRRSGSRRRSGR